jgi:hypothetical protein
MIIPSQVAQSPESSTFTLPSSNIALEARDGFYGVRISTSYKREGQIIWNPLPSKHLKTLEKEYHKCMPWAWKKISELQGPKMKVNWQLEQEARGAGVSRHSCSAQGSPCIASIQLPDDILLASWNQETPPKLGSYKWPHIKPNPQGPQPKSKKHLDLPNLANRSTGYPIKLELQYLGQTYLRKLYTFWRNIWN